MSAAAAPIACVVLPTYNEAGNVRVLIPRIFAEGARIESHELHVLVVDDGSSDGTADVVIRLMERYPRLHLITGTKKGLGDAYKRGLAHAMATLRPDLMVQMDADLQHDPCLLPEFVTLCVRGADVVVGSRFVPGGATPDFSWWRTLLSRVANWLLRSCTGFVGVRDHTSGYRCIRGELLQCSSICSSGSGSVGPK